MFVIFLIHAFESTLKSKKLSIPPTHGNHFKTLLGVDISDIDTMKDFLENVFYG